MNEYLPGLEGVPWLTAHSMYFLVIGELGLPGIVTFLVLLASNMRANSGLRRRLVSLDASAAECADPEARRTLLLLNASMVGFAMAGAFLSVAYYPHVFVLTGLMIAVRASTQAKLGDRADQGVGDTGRRGRRGRKSYGPVSAPVRRAGSH